MELTRFRTEMGEPARIYDVNRIFEVLEELSAANPIRDHVPASAEIRDRSPDELEYSEHLVKDLTNLLIDAAKTGIGWHDVFLFAVKEYGYYPDLFNIALDLAKSPISFNSHTVINRAIDEDVYAGRLLWHPERDCDYQLPVDYIGYNYDRDAWVISPVYPIESVAFEFLEPRVTFSGAPGSSSDALVATVEAPYELSGILPIPNLGGQLSVRETFEITRNTQYGARPPPPRKRVFFGPAPVPESPFRFRSRHQRFRHRPRVRIFSPDAGDSGSGAAGGRPETCREPTLPYHHRKPARLG